MCKTDLADIFSFLKNSAISLIIKPIFHQAVPFFKVGN